MHCINSCLLLNMERLTVMFLVVAEEEEEEDAHTPSSRPRQPSVSVYAICPPAGCQAMPHTV